MCHAFTLGRLLPEHEIFLHRFSSRLMFPFLFPRLVILRVHAHGLVTIDLQCYEDDNISQLDNVRDLNSSSTFTCFVKAKTFSKFDRNAFLATCKCYIVYVLFLSSQLLNALEKKLKVLLNGNIARIKK